MLMHHHAAGLLEIQPSSTLPPLHTNLHLNNRHHNRRRRHSRRPQPPPAPPPPDRIHRRFRYCSRNPLPPHHCCLRCCSQAVSPLRSRRYCCHSYFDRWSHRHRRHSRQPAPADRRCSQAAPAPAQQRPGVAAVQAVPLVQRRLGGWPGRAGPLPPVRGPCSAGRAALAWNL